MEPMLLIKQYRIVFRACDATHEHRVIQSGPSHIIGFAGPQAIEEVFESILVHTSFILFPETSLPDVRKALPGRSVVSADYRNASNRLLT